MKRIGSIIVPLLLLFGLSTLGAVVAVKKVSTNFLSRSAPSSGHEGESMQAGDGVETKDIIENEETHDAVLFPGESAKVQCGDGNKGITVDFNKGNFSGNLGLGDQTDVSIRVKDSSNHSAGALVEWRLFYYGSLTIDGCQAIYTAPDSIGSAYQVSAEIQAGSVKIAVPQPQQKGGGEGGPISVDIMPSTKINIYNVANKPGSNNSNNTNNTRSAYCNSGYTYNYSSQMFCPNAYPHYYNGYHGIYARGCYVSCPYIGDCSEKTTRY